jgi:hypothetical protein
MTNLNLLGGVMREGFQKVPIISLHEDFCIPLETFAFLWKMFLKGPPNTILWCPVSRN